MKLQNKNLRGRFDTGFRFTPLDKNSLLELYRKSRTVIDIQHPKQTGLTMRCIENRGGETQVDYYESAYQRNTDFYDENNILAVNRENPIVPTGFLSRLIGEISAEVYETTGSIIG